MTVAHTFEGGVPEQTYPPTSTQESQDTNTNTQNQPPTTSATATATAPSNPPIYSAAQPASMSSLPEATVSVQESDPAVDTPTETTNPTPASTTSPPPPPQPGARPEPLPVGGLDSQAQGQGQDQIQSMVPPPPKVGEPIPQQPGIEQMGGPAPVATSTASATPYGYGGYGYGYNSNTAAPAQQQYQYQQQYQNQYGNQIPNSTTTPFASVYPPPQPTSSALPMHYQTDNNRNIMAEDGEEEKGFLDMAKGWMQTAGDKLVQVEAEVWRRINDAHDK